MAATDDNQMDDLEDGEIESDSEQQVEAPVAEAPKTTTVAVTPVADKIESATNFTTSKKVTTETSIEKKLEKKAEKEKKKSSKEHSKKSDKERRLHNDIKIIREHPPSPPAEDDFARDIEKAIQKVLKKSEELSNKNGASETNKTGDDDEKKKHKKRKKSDHSEKEKDKDRDKDREIKKRKRNSNADEDDVDEDELMCVRGASPVRKHKRTRIHSLYHSDDEPDSYPSDASDDRDMQGRDRMHNRAFRGRMGMGRDFRDRMRNNRFDRNRYDRHPSQDPDGICLFYMQGKCYKGDDCIYSHDARPPRKMELCKFYLKDCCAKRDKCLYLHSDFPCKYYHTGLPCMNKSECKFSHGKALSNNLKGILLKHIESAPKEILGDFPRLSREAAVLMITNTQKRLKKEFGDSPNDPPSPSPSDKNNDMEDSVMIASNDMANRDKGKRHKRQSRWCDSSPTNPLTQNILSVQNLSGVLTTQQICDLITMGIENINQLTNLTVHQLNELGITANQINDIQLNTMNIQKLGLIENNAGGSPSVFTNNAKSKDLDMRVSPALPEISTRSNSKKSSEMLGQDIDMRFQSNISNSSDRDNKKSDTHSSDPRKNRNSLDIDQYKQDALKFSKLDKEEFPDSIKSPNEVEELKDVFDVKKDLDVDHRVLKYVSDANIAHVKLDEDEFIANENDTDIRISSLPIKQQQMYLRIQKNEEKARRLTTDDEDDILQIDEKWYSSDEENNEKSTPVIKSPKETEEDVSKSATSPQPIEPTIVLKNLGDLSKIDISDEVTKLLTSMKQSSEESIANNTSSSNTNTSTSANKKEYLKSRDPRNIAKVLNENKDSTIDSSKKLSSKPEFISIYDCAENSNPDARRRVDVDLRPTKDLDLRIPAFGDTDLRQTPGGSDIDLRLGLHFKPIPNYTPATEIDGSFGSHAPISYKVSLVDIPKPDYSDIKNSTPVSQASGDPRLRKIFRLSFDDTPTESAAKTVKSTTSATAATTTRIDPRKRSAENIEKQISSKPPSLDLSTITQTSDWYKELKSNQKILINQQLAIVMSNLKKFHQDPSPGKFFDLTDIKSDNLLCMIFSNLGVFLDEKGEFFRINSNDNTVSSPSPMGFNNAKSENFGMMDNMNMMPMNNMVPGNVGGMGNMNAMGNFNSRFQMSDNRNVPGGGGMMGMPPNMPPNFDNFNNGMGNFNPDNNFANYDNAMYNGPPRNNENDYMDGNNYEDYYPDQNNYNYNNGGRNNDNWNRGRSRGGRDRRGFTERPRWKNDRN